MEVQVNVSLDDQTMINFMKYHLFTGRVGITILALGMMNIGLTVAFLIKGSWGYALLFVLFAAFILLGFPFRMTRQIAGQVSKMSEESRKVTYTLSDGGIKTETAKKSGNASWTTFQKAVVYKDILLIYDARRQAIILPKEQLAEKYDSICELIRKQMPPKCVHIKE